MKNKKIFFLADARSIHTVKWVDYFIEQNYQVHLATFADINNTKCSNIYFLADKTASYRGGNYHYLFSISKLAKILKEVNPDIINAHYSYSMGLIALLAKNRAKIKSFFTVVCHGSDILSPPNRYIFDKINHYVLKNSDKVVVVSDQIKDKLENLGIDVKKIFIAQYGINLEREDFTEKDIDILSNRAYNSNSRIDFLLDSLVDLEKQKLNIVFVVPNIQDKEFDSLVMQYPTIKFYKHLPYKEMVSIMKRVKVYISATKSDGTSLSLLEAMSYKTIPVISNIVANRSWILDGVNGYLFNSRVDFIEKLTTALKNENKSIQKINRTLLRDRGEYNTQMRKIEKFLLK